MNAAEEERYLKAIALTKLTDFQKKFHHLGPVEYDAMLLQWINHGIDDCFGLCELERDIILDWRNK